jgi:hypothetical protein
MGRSPPTAIPPDTPTAMSQQSTDTDTQQRITALVSSIDVSAPASLHGSVRGLLVRARPRQRVWVRRRALLGGALAAATVLVVSLVLALGSSGGPGAPPTVLQASTLGLRPATLSAPAENPNAPGQLAISAGGIAYPYWDHRFGWRTAGVRSDRLGGRAITTVFYANSSGRRIGYSIVDGQALPLPAGGHAAVWRGTRFDVLHPGATTVVTWHRAGHTCILVGSKVSARTLLTLANWQAT